jgi:hypothetical protein
LGIEKSAVYINREQSDGRLHRVDFNIQLFAACAPKGQNSRSCADFFMSSVHSRNHRKCLRSRGVRLPTYFLGRDSQMVPSKDHRRNVTESD